MDEDVVKFWREFEAETRERVEAKGVAERYEGNTDRGEWCLLVLTDKSLWFKQMPSDSWISSLFRPRVLSASSRRADESDLRIPRVSLRSLTEPGPRRWFSRPAFPVLTLTWQEGDTLRSRRFSVDPSAELLPSLRKLFRARPDPSR
jgi:hypothetical protein